MEGKKKLDQSNSSILENSKFLYTDNQNNNTNEDYQKYQDELLKYETQHYNNQRINQSNNSKNGNQYHFRYSGHFPENNQNNIINVENGSTFSFGSNPKQSTTSLNQLENSIPLTESQKLNINQEALSFEDSNILNSTHLDLTNSIAIKKESNLFTKGQYVTFSNNYGDNSCYVNVVLHLLFNITDLNNIFKDLHKIDELQKQNPKENSNSNANTIIDTSSGNNKNNENLTQSKNNNSSNWSNPLNELFVEIGEILSDYEMYLNPEYATQQITILDTKNLRNCLEKISNGLFPLNYVADPVELFIYILDNLNINYGREMHNNFHMELIDKVVCRMKCPNTSKNKYDKDNFLYQIYVEELINYIADNAIKFKNSKGDLFHLSYSLYEDDKKECQKCTLLMEKFLICLNIPKYLLINCVWKNEIPEVKQIVNFLFLLSLEEDLNNLFVCQNRTRNTDTNYYLLGVILYSFTLCHYTVLIYNRKEKVFALYNDNTVKEFKTLYDVFPEMLINNVNLYDNDKGYFYPVMLIYTKEKIYDRNVIKKNTLDEREYVGLLNNIEENQNLFIQKHTLTEEQKKKNLEELIEKQKEYEKEKINKKTNNKNNIANNNSINNFTQNNNNNANDWMNYNFEDDKKKNPNQILVNNDNENDIKMTNNDYYDIYGNDLLTKPTNNVQEYKNYFNDLNNLNIDDLIKQKNANNNIINNNQNEFLRNIHEQSNSSFNNNIESSQRMNFNNNDFGNDFCEFEANRLAQSQVLPTTKYFSDTNKYNNNLNKKKNRSINNNNYIPQEVKTPMGNNTNKNSYIPQEVKTPMGNNSNKNTDIPQEVKTPMGNNNNKNTYILQEVKTPMGNNTNNQRKNVMKLSSSQQININDPNFSFNNDQNNLNSINNVSNLSNSQYSFGNNRPNLSSSQYNVRSGNSYTNKTNKDNNQNKKGTTIINNTRPNLTNSQSNNRRSNNNINPSNSVRYQNNNDLSINTNNKPNLAQSQIIWGNNNNDRNNLSQSYTNAGTSVNNRKNLLQSQNNMGRRSNRQNNGNNQNNTGSNNNKTNLAQSHYNIGRNNI